jgi:hypothetical protein
LAEVALDGLPRRVAQRQSPTFAEYVDEFWRDCAHHWKPSTQKRNWDAIRLDITPQFGPMRLDIICRSDIIRWRDDCAEEAGEVQPRAAGAGGDAEICRGAGVSAQGEQSLPGNAALQAQGDGAVSQPAGVSAAWAG